jgi:FkbM family methyltransferase
MTRDFSVFTHLYSPGDTPSDCIRAGRFYEESTLLKFKPLIHDEGLFLDIGANIGNHSVMFSQYFPDRTIISFEANPFNYTLLANNVSKIPNITAICCGLGEQMELVEFIHFAPSPGCSRLKQYFGDMPGDSTMCGTSINDCPTVNIIIQPLDLFNLDNVKFIKIDVESHELFVFKGGIDTIKKNKPVIWIEDFKYESDRENSGTQFLIDTLGYHIAADDIDNNYLLKCE